MGINHQESSYLDLECHGRCWVDYYRSYQWDALMPSRAKLHYWPIPHIPVQIPIPTGQIFDLCYLLPTP